MKIYLRAIDTEGKPGCELINLSQTLMSLSKLKGVSITDMYKVLDTNKSLDGMIVSTHRKPSFDKYKWTPPSKWSLYDHAGNVIGDNDTYQAGYYPAQVLDILSKLPEAFDVVEITSLMYSGNTTFKVGDILVRSVRPGEVPSALDLNHNYLMCENHEHNRASAIHRDQMINIGDGLRSRECIMCKLPTLLNYVKFKDLLIEEAKAVGDFDKLKENIDKAMWFKYVYNFGIADAQPVITQFIEAYTYFTSTYVVIGDKSNRMLKFESLFHARMYSLSVSDRVELDNPLMDHNDFVDSCTSIEYTDNAKGVIEVYEESIIAGTSKINKFFSKLNEV